MNLSGMNIYLPAILRGLLGTRVLTHSHVVNGCMMLDDVG